MLGERVEAYTNPLWVAILAVWGALHGPLAIGAVMLVRLVSLASLSSGIGRLGARRAPAAREPRAAERPLALPLGALSSRSSRRCGTSPPRASSPGLSIGWLGLVFWRLARAWPITPGGARWLAFAIGCGPLVRPDLGLFSAGFAVALAVLLARGPAPRPRAREAARLALIAGALPAAYQIFRMGYFAALVPNTALAKEASASYWSQGWRYTLDFAGPYVLWLPLLAVAAWLASLVRSALRQRDTAAAVLVLAPVLGALAHWLYITRVGGDFMHGRLLLPSLFGLLLPVATVLVPTRALRGWRGVAVAGVAAWAVAGAFWLRVPYAGQGAPGPWGIADERDFYTDRLGLVASFTIANYRGYGWEMDGTRSASSPRRGASWRSRSRTGRTGRSSSSSRRACPRTSPRCTPTWASWGTPPGCTST